ncbi:MAG: copper resistance system multicopper oxidase [Arenicella sp.]
MDSFDFSLSRRRFVTGLATSTALGLMGASPLLRTARAASASNQSKPQVLSGKRFDLNVGYTAVNFTGKTRQATTVNNSLPAPVLRWKQGDTVTLNVHNNLAEDSSIHWHGIILPSNMDGVPGMSFAGIKPGESYQYQFTLNQSGTYWYHSHSGFQEQTGVYGAIVVDPIDPEPYAYDRDYVVLLSDWSDTKPSKIFANLKKLPHIYNMNERTLRDWQREVSEKGFNAVRADRAMWGQMRMSDRDISDVTGATYTFLMNGQTPAQGWYGKFNKGEKILLRFINGSAMTFFDIRIPGLKMTVVASDGQYIQPVSVDEFRIGVAETYDVIVEPSTEQAYTLFCQSIDRSGYARGTLAPHPDMAAQIPEMDESPILSHTDMGMSHGNHGSHGANESSSCTPEHAAMGHCTISEQAHDHGSHSTNHHANHNAKESAENSCTPEHAAMGHCTMPSEVSSNMPSNDHGHHAGHHQQHAMANKPEPSCTAEHAAMGHCEMPEEQTHGHHNNQKIVQNFASGKAGYGTTKPISYDNVKMGPHIDMLAESAQYRLDDPGVGLRNNGRRVLTYADIFNLNKTPDPREPSREIELHLTGNMSRYMWSIDGVRGMKADPIMMKYGERVRITLVNDTMMNHPVHLHGVWSDLETGDGEYIPRKHTVVVQPGAKISYLVTADARGKWAYHCHLLYHMMGMFREVHIT